MSKYPAQGSGLRALDNYSQPPAPSPQLLILFLLLILSPTAQAAVSSSADKQLDTGSTNQGGGETSGTNTRQQGVLGQPIGGSQMTSSRFSFFPGSLGASTSPTTTLPVSSLALSALYAKTEPLGKAIAASTWQRDRDPIFYWDPPATGPEVAGYSYALDGAPDDAVDTAAQSFNIATSTLKMVADGRHTFSVKAINSAGNGGPASAFEIWVDTTPPAITAAAPAAGAMLKTLSSSVSATITDTSSGVDDAAIELLVNNSAVAASFDQATGAMTATPTGWVQGSNRIELRVADKVGNSQTPLVWSIIMDTIPPSGSITINAGASVTTSVYVTLGLNATDLTSGVAGMFISNDPLGSFVEEPYISLRSLWRLAAVRGPQAVYVKFVDGAGNVSDVIADTIDLALTSPETLITSGPSGFTGSDRAVFAYMCPEGNCVYAYALDHGSWSDWSETAKMATDALSPGNHYFRVKAAKETNGVSGIQSDEEDPSPAERTWIVGIEPSIMAMPKGPAVKVWRIE